MTIPREGSKVAYIGEGDSDLSIEDIGTVLSQGRSGSHIHWLTGKRKGQITLTHNDDLVSYRSQNVTTPFANSGIVTFAVRDVYDRSGTRGLIEALGQDGHLSSLIPLGEEALGVLTSRLRQDPSLREVLAELEPEEGEEVIAVTAGMVLREYIEGN